MQDDIDIVKEIKSNQNFCKFLAWFSTCVPFIIFIKPKQNTIKPKQNTNNKQINKQNKN